MTTHTISDFHGDDVWRDENGTSWVRQSQMLERMAYAWDEGNAAGWTDGAIANTRGLDEGSEAKNPYERHGDEHRN